jgi:spore maturation protein SpmB
VTQAEGEPPAPPFAIALRRSLGVALRAYADLLLILVPTFVAVTLIKHSPFLPWMSERLAPAMGHFGLPGSAALPILLAGFVSLYAALAAMAGLGLSPGEVTTLALMLGLCHNLIVEGAILFRLRANPLLWTVVRIAMAALAGMVVGPWLAGGKP